MLQSNYADTGSLILIKIPVNTIIHTPTPKLKESLSFYQRLGFSILSEAPSLLLSDGQFLLEINPDRYARAGIKLVRESWGEVVAKLEKHTTVSKIDGGFLLGDPSGVSIYLIEKENPVTLSLSGISPAILGTFAGISLESNDLSRSIGIWELLGFEKTMGSLEQGWVAYKNEDEMTLSFMRPNTCPHLFFNPSLTYFNGKENLAIIQKIRDAGIPITEEITHFNQEGIIDNIIIRDPGGYGFFIFND